MAGTDSAPQLTNDMIYDFNNWAAKHVVDKIAVIESISLGSQLIFKEIVNGVILIVGKVNVVDKTSDFVVYLKPPFWSGPDLPIGMAGGNVQSGVQIQIDNSQNVAQIAQGTIRFYLQAIAGGKNSLWVRIDLQTALGNWGQAVQLVKEL